MSRSDAASPLGAATRSLAPWMVAVPLLNLWFLFMKVPEAMSKAKLAAGNKTPTKAGWMYLLFSPYALSADLNDLA